jgi:hypothetical protein
LSCFDARDAPAVADLATAKESFNGAIFKGKMVLSDDSDIDDLIDGDNATRERGAYCVLPPACATLVRGSVRCCCAACRWC